VQVTTNVQGLASLQRKLALLPERIGRNAGRRALRKGANVIRDAAKANARKFDDATTREMIWKNITVSGGGVKRERRVGGTMMRVGIRGGARNMEKYGEFRGAGKGNPGGDTWYWRLLEFGTSKMAAKPFMRPAMNESSGRAAQVVIEAMNVEFDKEAAKLAAMP
jgi:HK97 gp10 family phage protein